MFSNSSTDIRKPILDISQHTMTNILSSPLPGTVLATLWENRFDLQWRGKSCSNIMYERDHGYCVRNSGIAWHSRSEKATSTSNWQQDVGHLLRLNVTFRVVWLAWKREGMVTVRTLVRQLSSQIFPFFDFHSGTFEVEHLSVLENLCSKKIVC